MADIRVLVLPASGKPNRQGAADRAIVGAGIVSDGVGANLDVQAGSDAAGTILVKSSAQLAAGKDLSGAAGIGSVNFSSMTGTFSTPTGAATHNGSSSTFANVINANGGVQRSTGGAGALYTDANTTTITIGGGAAQTSMTLGKVAQIATFLGSVTITQNLVVNGTTTTINSTTVDIADRVVHVNHSTGANDPVPSAICGLAVHRGAVASVDRDHSAIFWDEANSRWNFALNTGGDDSTIGADQAMKMGALTVTSSITQSNGAVSLTANAASSFTTSSGALTFTSAAAATWSTSAGALSVSGFAGLNLQGGGTTALVVNSSGTAITVQAGATLATTGSGNINLPNNGSARFKIESTSVGATVTAVNLDTLTNSSNADALHTHSSSMASDVRMTSKTAGETVNAKALVAFQNNGGTPNVYNADANGASPLPNAVGFAVAGAVATGSIDVYIDGEISVPTTQFDSAPAVGDVGKPVFMSETAGQITLTAPTASGSTVQKVGIVTDGSASPKVLIQIGDGFVLA